MSIPLFSLINAAPTSDGLNLNSISDILASQQANTTVDSLSLLNFIEEAKQNTNNDTQKHAMSELKSLIQKTDASHFDDQLKIWLASYGSNAGIDDFDEFTKNIHLYTKHRASLYERDSSVTAATGEQLRILKKHAMIASGAYCVATIPTWSCTRCKQAVSDGKIVKTFKTPLTDTNGFVMTSANDKTIYLSFRGSISSRNWMTVKIYSETRQLLYLHDFAYYFRISIIALPASLVFQGQKFTQVLEMINTMLAVYSI